MYVSESAGSPCWSGKEKEKTIKKIGRFQQRRVNKRESGSFSTITHKFRKNKNPDFFIDKDNIMPRSLSYDLDKCKVLSKSSVQSSDWGASSPKLYLSTRSVLNTSLLYVSQHVDVRVRRAELIEKIYSSNVDTSEIVRAKDLLLDSIIAAMNDKPIMPPIAT